LILRARASAPGLHVQFLRYASAGAVGTVIHYALLVALVQGLDVAAVAASTIGAVIGAAVNYLLNHRYTFASRRPHRQALRRFALVAAVGVVINGAVLAGVLAFVGPHYLLGQVLATGAVLVFGYAVNRTWTF
jgi:putative flippase GtrA